MLIIGNKTTHFFSAKDYTELHLSEFPSPTVDLVVSNFPAIAFRYIFTWSLQDRRQDQPVSTS